MSIKEKIDIQAIQDGHCNPITQIFFRAGLLACREYMARFVEAQNPNIAASIRANWWPSLGEDFGPPRQLEWGEITEGVFGTDEFRCKTADEISPTLEALPIAYGFLMDRTLGGSVDKFSNEFPCAQNALNDATDGEDE